MNRPPTRHLQSLGSIAAIVLAMAVAGCASAAPASPTPWPDGGQAGPTEPTPRPSPSATVAVPLPPPTPSTSVPSAPASPVPPAASADSAASPALDPPPAPGPFAIDLYRKGDFVSQATTEWCVPAAILTMMNVIDGGAEGGDRPSQRRLDRLARSLSSPRLKGPGSEPEGWAKVLNGRGYGRYTVVAEPTRRAALEAAARALRLTGRPVGILVWRGAHGWVMTGFEATADPAWTEEFRVTRVRVSDPWYPRRTATWGRPPAPDTRMSLRALARVYRPWRRPLARYEELDGRFVLVLPVVPTR